MFLFLKGFGHSEATNFLLLCCRVAGAADAADTIAAKFAGRAQHVTLVPVCFNCLTFLIVHRVGMHRACRYPHIIYATAYDKVIVHTSLAVLPLSSNAHTLIL